MNGPKRSWLGRLLDLGNDNKIIAAATLITIATGVPYLVTTALGAFTEEAEEDAPITREVLEEALQASLQRAQREADEAELEGEAASPVSREATNRALEALGDTARRPEATEEERERILVAYQQYSMGNPGAALAEFERVAVEQEERGATEQAAETWRHRGALRYHTDPRAAIHDLVRAYELDPGSAADQYLMVSLGSSFFDDQQFIWLLRRTIRAAREEEDLDTLARALSDFAMGGEIQGRLRDLGMEGEIRGAQDEGIEVLEELLLERPQDLHYYSLQGMLMRNRAVAVQTVAYSSEFHEWVHEAIEAAETLQHPEIREPLRYVVLTELHAQHVWMLRSWRGASSESTTEESMEAVESLRSLLADRTVTLIDLKNAGRAASILWLAVTNSEVDPVAMEVAEVGLRIAEAAAQRRQSGYSMAGQWEAHIARCLHAGGEVEAAREQLQRACEVEVRDEMRLKDKSEGRAWIAAFNMLLNEDWSLNRIELEFGTLLLEEMERILDEDFPEEEDLEQARSILESRRGYHARYRWGASALHDAREAFAAGRFEEGIARTREGLARKEEAIPFFSEPERGWFEFVMAHVTATGPLPPEEAEFNEEMFRRARAIAGEHLGAANQATIETAIEDTREALAEYASRDSEETDS